VVWSCAVVDVWAEGDEAPKGADRSVSRLLTEAGGLLARSSDRLWGRRGVREVDSLRSMPGLVLGGGILILERSAEARVVSIWWGARRTSACRLAANNEWVEGVRPLLSAAGREEDPTEEPVEE